ncbi:MAG: hypothetical protein AB1735_02455 [Pseudomonadota bacterium]
MPHALLDLDFGNRLEITINNQKPVVLTDLTLALLGVGQQFERFIENETQAQQQVGAELYIKDVRSGSIVVELVAQFMPVVPLLWQGGSLLEWVKHAQWVIEWLNGKLTHPPKDLSKSDLRQWSNILEPVAKDGAAQMNFTVAQGGRVVNQFIISSEQASAAQNGIRRQLEALNEPDDHVQRKCVMFWSQTKFADNANTGDRAVIESISTQPVKVIFENNAVKKAMLAGDARFARQWHELAYIVDVRVQTVRGVPKVYTIIDYHVEDTFDPDAD